MVYEKFLEGNQHGITEIEIMSVFIHLLGEYFTGVDDARYVLHLDIFGMMEFPNHVSSEIEVFDTFLCN